jgi:hypothetical protein
MLISVVIPAFDEGAYPGRTPVRTNPLFVPLFRRRPSFRRGWYEEVPR